MGKYAGFSIWAIKTRKTGLRKAEDKIDFLSTYGYEAAKNWFYSANFNFKSQFAEGYDYHDDDTLAKGKDFQFLAPGQYFTWIGYGKQAKRMAIDLHIASYCQMDYCK